MAKIVLDTNIIVRAVASPSGLASELLRRTISDGNLLCTSNFMLAELDRVLRRSLTIAKHAVWKWSPIPYSSQSYAVKIRNSQSMVPTPRR
jgi:predicted nucleic acid-binding protein